MFSRFFKICIYSSVYCDHAATSYLYTYSNEFHAKKANMSRWTRKDSADNEDFICFCLYTILKINTQ